MSIACESSVVSSQSSVVSSTKCQVLSSKYLGRSSAPYYLQLTTYNTTYNLLPKAAAELKATVGVVEHGLFCGMTTAVIIAGKDGISEKKA